MSSLQDKMYNHEVNPPVNAWGKIAAALDEANLQNEFPSKLYDIEIAPPTTAWEKITADLDKKQIENKFPSRLYNMEVAPPVTVWKKIADILNIDAKTSTTVIKRLPPILRYAAAAIFIGAIAYGVIRFPFNANNLENSAARVADLKDSSISNNSKPTDTGKAQTDKINANQPKEEMPEKNKSLVATTSDNPIKRTYLATMPSAATANANNGEKTGEDLSQSIYAYADHIPAISDRYIMLMTPDGNIIRMSKKWGDLLCCVSGEEQDADCKDQLKKWQEKIATSSLAPSPENFMDILGLVNSLNDNNDL